MSYRKLPDNEPEIIESFIMLSADGKSMSEQNKKIKFDEGIGINGPYKVMSEEQFIQFKDFIDGRYYDDRITNIHDLRVACNDAISILFGDEN